MEFSKIIMSVVDVSLEAAPWLMLGLIAAGVVRAVLPTSVIVRWMGGSGIRSTVVAALVGAPLPLCSCGVLPVAMGLRQGGASKGATASFLIATPETGLDSIALSYALLGPFLAIVRPIAAILSAILAGLGVTLVDRGEDEQETPAPLDAVGRASRPSSVEKTGETPVPPDTCTAACCETESTTKAACCSGESAPVSACCESATPDAKNTDRPSFPRRIAEGLAYSFTDLFSDIALWLGVGLLFAGVMRALVDPGALASFGNGIGAMLVMLVAGVPLYICASASTPVAAGLLAAGVSPGVAVVLLLAGPATNIGSIGVVKKHIGARATAVYLVALSVTALGAGLVTDLLVNTMNIDVSAQIGAGARMVPQWLAIGSAIVLLFFAIKPARRAGARVLDLGRRTLDGHA